MTVDDLWSISIDPALTELAPHTVRHIRAASDKTPELRNHYNCSVFVCSNKHKGLHKLATEDAVDEFKL